MGWNAMVLASIDIVLFILCVIAELSLFILFITNAYFCAGCISPTSSIESRPNINRHTSVSVKSASPSSPSSKTATDKNVEQEIYQYTQKKNKMQTIPRVYKTLTSLSLFCGLITVSTNCLYRMLEMYGDLSVKSISCSLDNVPILFLFIQRLTLWLYFIYRIEITFKDSVFSMNARKLTVFKIFICINGTLVNLFYFVYIEINHCHPDAPIIGFIPLAINDIFICIVTLIVFINRLKKVMKLNLDQKSVHIANIKLKHVIKKLTVLVLVSISSSICLIAFFAIIPLLATLAIDVVINSLCLLLSYIYYTKYYNTLCCLCVKSVDGMASKSKSSEHNKANNAANHVNSL